MSSEHAEESSQPQRQQGEQAPKNGTALQPATVLVRGETMPNQSSTSPTPANAQKTPVTKKVSEAKLKLQNRLPSLDDFDDVGTQKDQVVVRDGKPDLAFTGTLLASAAPTTATKGHWEELRVYQTSAGKHVFSKIIRTLYVGEADECKAEVFDPAPSSTTAQLLRSAHDLTHAKPKTWKDAAVDFFGYEPLAKELYRKLGDQFEERVS
jgi:hypothetical protein